MKEWCLDPYVRRETWDQINLGGQVAINRLGRTVCSLLEELGSLSYGNGVGRGPEYQQKNTCLADVTCG